LSDVFAVILAAGAGTRMGRPKAMARIGGRTFLDTTIQAIFQAGLTKLSVVLAHAANEIEAAHNLDQLIAIRNPDPSAGPISSIRAALSHPEVAGAPAILVHPVDHPLVQADTVRRLIEHFEHGESAIVVPRYGGRGGHPTVFGRTVFPELLQVPAGEGARSVVRRDPNRVLRVDVSDPGVRLNLDSPEDLARLDGAE
jgi:nicotine blue oxidoreductase